MPDFIRLIWSGDIEWLHRRRWNWWHNNHCLSCQGVLAAANDLLKRVAFAPLVMKEDGDGR